MLFAGVLLWKFSKYKHALNDIRIISRDDLVVGGHYRSINCRNPRRMYLQKTVFFYENGSVSKYS